jgi:hypothetical protein
MLNFHKFQIVLDKNIIKFILKIHNLIKLYWKSHYQDYIKDNCHFLQVNIFKYFNYSFIDVIYDICFKLISYREIGSLMIQYSAENLFNL